MILENCPIPVNDRSQELKPHGNAAFPCAGYAYHYRQDQGDNVLWHWHDEIEIIYIEKGQMTAKVPSQTFLLKAGDILAVNGNTLHYAMAAPECDLRSFVFSPSLITGSDDSALAVKYIRPLLTCPSFSAFYCRGSQDDTTARRFRTAFKAMTDEPSGFEFTVREELSQICLFLYDQFRPDGDAPSEMQSLDEERIKKMLTYIHTHFEDPLTVTDIAGAAAISQRECLRCFQKTIQLSPIQYVLKYRIMQGADLLLTKPTKNIAAIAAACGFDSQSHFAKTFKRFYAHTPREYRKKHGESRSTNPGRSE